MSAGGRDLLEDSKEMVLTAAGLVRTAMLVTRGSEVGKDGA